MDRSVKVVRTKKNIVLICLVVFSFLAIFVFANIDKLNKANALGGSSNAISPFAANSFDLSSSVSKKEAISYTDQVVLNFTVKHNDTASVLKNGMLVIDFNGKSFDPINFATNNVGNSNIISAAYDVSSRLLTVKLKDPITSGTQFDYSVVAIPMASTSHDDTITAKGLLSGNSSAGVAYISEATVTPSVKYNNPTGSFEPIDPSNPDWKIEANKNYSLYPGQTQTGGLYFWIRNQTNSNESFSNLKVRYEESSNASGVFYGTNNTRIGGKNASSTQVRNIYGKTITNTPTEQFFEFGEINGNVDKTLLNFFNGAVPTNATAGTVYTLTMSIYDEDNLIAQSTITITVKEISTNITFGTVVTPVEVKEPSGTTYDYFDWKQNNRIDTAGDGVKEYTVTLNIPDGTSPKQLSPPSNTASYIKKVEYQKDGNWIACTKRIGVAYDLSDVPSDATKLRYIYNDVKAYSGPQTYNFPFVRFVNRTNLAGTVITLKVDSVTYIDHTGATKSVSGMSSYDKTLKIVSDSTKSQNFANANVMNANGQTTPWNTPQFNGQNIYQSVRLGAVNKELTNPYVYMIAPKGLDIDNNPNTVMKIVKPYTSGFDVYTLTAYGQDITYPKSSSDIKYESYDLGDNVLHFWSLEGLALKGEGLGHTQIMGGDVKYKINNLTSGTYDVVYGMGSLTDDSYGVSGGTPYGGLQFTSTNATVKEKISKVVSNKEFTTTKKLVIGINNSVNTKMEIKGSQDSAFIDATAGTATSIPGKKVDYQVTLSNAGTNDLTNFEAVEILPFLGDKLSTDPNQARGSQFNVNLGSKPKVLIDGIESNDVEILYSLSNDPIRFDANGNQIGTGAWTNVPPTDLSTVKAIKIAMKTKPFKIGSTMQLEFSGTLPLDAPRNGEIAYNTIAMKADTTTVTGPGIFVSEPAKGGVKSTAPATDIELSGKIYMDFDKSGSMDSGEIGHNGVTLNLYKKNGANFEKIETLTTAPDGSNNPGIFGFTGIDNGTYKIEVVKPELASFVTSGANSFEIISGDRAWLKLNGSTEFSVDDLAAGNPEKITNLAGPLYAESEFKGEIKFVDKNGSEVADNNYGEGFKIQLQDASGVNIGSPVFTDENGKFVISHLVTQVEDYKIVITKPKAGFNYPAAENSPDFDILTETYTYKSVNPAHSVLANISISDSDLPTVAINLDKNDNPTNITVNPEDETTKTTVEWTIKKDGIVISSGTGAVQIPTEYGDYIIEAIARDGAQNESELKSVNFTISEIITPEPLEPNPDENTNSQDITVPNTGQKKSAKKFLVQKFFEKI